jgi:hypothetical protein
MDRRTFIQAGMLTALPLATGARLVLGSAQPQAAHPLEPQQRVPLYTVVYDERFADSVAFADEARRLGQRVSAIAGDVTGLWYDDLFHRWQRSAVAIAGMTTRDAFFCLEIFGNDAGLRRVLRVDHEAGASRVAHRFHGPQAAIASAGLEQCGADWSARMAHVVTGCSSLRDRIHAVATSTSGTRAAGDQPVLVSWMLVPRPLVA